MTLLPRTRARTTKARFIPCLESLEDRRLLACSTGVSGETLTVNGDDSGNNISILDDGVGGITLTCDGITTGFAPISIIVVNSGEGNDTVTYSQTNNLKQNRKVTVNLGDDDDVFQTTRLTKDQRDGTFTLNVNGEEDDDLLVVDARGLSLEAGVFFRPTLNGGDDDDNIRIRYKGTVIGKVVYTGIGGEGEDTMYGELISFTGSTGRIVAAAYGEDDDDTITLLLRRKAGVTSPQNGLINGGDGDNTCIRTPNVAATNCEHDTVINI